MDLGNGKRTGHHGGGWQCNLRIVGSARHNSADDLDVPWPLRCRTRRVVRYWPEQADRAGRPHIRVVVQNQENISLRLRSG